MNAAISTVRDRYQSLEVARIVHETDDAVSVVFDVPEHLASDFAYRPGQFVTLRTEIGGDVQLRSYSMSSSPSTDDQLQVTVKRVPGGVVSNWVNDHVGAGDTLDVSLPAGAFLLTDSADEVVAFAAGSGITPVFSILKAVLHDTDRPVRLLFANRDRSSAIFGEVLDELAARHDGRLVIRHHEDVADGFVSTDDVIDFLGGRSVCDVYLCGPTGFMDVVEDALSESTVPADRVHVERFTPVDTGLPDDGLDGDAPVTVEHRVTITVGRRTETVVNRDKNTLLGAARFAGLPIQASCEMGHCGTCIARVVEGHVKMLSNDVLTDDEVADGLVLTCQSIPLSDVEVVYDA